MNDSERREVFDSWLADRPEVIQDLARRFPPWEWFRLTTDEEAHCYAYQPRAYAEDGTLTLRRWSVAAAQPMWDTFGIDPDDLEPCGSPEAERETWGAEQLAPQCFLDGAKVARLRTMVEGCGAEA